MSSRDKNGREYAKYWEVKPGDILEVDNGFTCIEYGEVRKVESDHLGLYIPCKDGHHYIIGQADKSGYLIGLYQVGW